MRPQHLLLLAAFLLAAAAPAEPIGLWPGPMEGAVPATLAGATVLPTPRAAMFFIGKHHPVLVDVSPEPVRPPDMAKNMPWRPAPHQDLPGSAWLPGAGRAVLQPARAKAYLAAIAKLTANDKNRFVVLYCHPDCWASYNAAKALLQAGYTHVAWFPPGIETWQSADFPTQTTTATVY